jgi:hypothetical protein
MTSLQQLAMFQHQLSLNNFWFLNIDDTGTDSEVELQTII